jgi:hypothetical protein
MSRCDIRAEAGEHLPTSRETAAASRALTL